MFPEERDKGVYDVDVHVPSSITSHGPGYIDRDSELVVGLQTDAPLKRAIISVRRFASSAGSGVPWLVVGPCIAVMELALGSV